MKFAKRIVWSIFIVLLVGILFRGGVYRSLISYQSLGERKNYTVYDPELVRQIDEMAKAEKPQDIREVVDLGLLITASQLKFTFTRNEMDPNRLARSKTAHCVGYAVFFASVCNYLLKKNDLEGDWIALPHAGQLYLGQTNVHAYFTSSFFKDHDFVILKNQLTGEILTIDPTLYDYLRIGFVTFKE
ncbi:hypothetical protein AAG747_28015 [Rapidithrix thailandica]|uniref:Transglutaminase-like domain-containing protein n=1 Tax=Rapidithrix thailandica TaxID=413964 RepID=A0AAW9SHP4_9BACT